MSDSSHVPPLDPASRVYVAGHRGLAGSAVWRELERRGFTDLVGVPSARLDLRDRPAVDRFFDEVRPAVVIDAAARVGGILANATQPADFLSDNVRIQVNLLDAAVRTGVQRFLFLGSTCIYPRLAPQPITEDALLTGPLEETNDAYAIAKITGVLHVQAIRRQFGLPYVSAMPTNLYGPGDNFSPTGSHVLPALLRRFHEAVRDAVPEVVCWGTGEPRREFLHSDDFASAAVFLLEHYDDPAPINVGVGEDLTIRELAETVADVVGFRGSIVWDTSKPDGTPRKLLSVDRLTGLGWKASIPLREGIEQTYRWFLEHEGEVRS
ncbi:GDP-L-fucose synthase [Cellulomonas sp. KH9]|uniref:GDP-L-fucose synthase family protein n=1 Tax=Cellulomonas sp. KH9 TaxID=1855324 RepID=UPI0008E27B91|nr:GDP-L-fucose synthase [Cellulomonas sp. KH9]SFK20887.1 GDP-L-fucose synthase [Cellulomonas sp. KH9]